ncbi:MAG: methyltransferase domain-containing protein, partial [Hyphomicrobiales bacterium]|nr:methyltransferase domain-containing protein [Hyphomicrobiales bacterium]
MAPLLTLRSTTARSIQPTETVSATEPQCKGVFNIDPILQEITPDLLLRPARARERIADFLQVQISDIRLLETDFHAIPCDVETIFSDSLGKLCVDEYLRFTGLLDSFDPSPMGHAYADLLTHNLVEVYFRNSITRLYHLITMLRSMGVMPGASILEVGAFYCYFAGPLQRLGYRVVAIDRYRQFGGALNGFLHDFRSSGGVVIESDEAHEVEDLHKLGKFDAVISMAVVEHVPHTPRDFLSSLASHVRSGGVLAIDTPNIARYFNR